MIHTDTEEEEEDGEGFECQQLLLSGIVLVKFLTLSDWELARTTVWKGPFFLNGSLLLRLLGTCLRINGLRLKVHNEQSCPLQQTDHTLSVQ